MKKLLLGAVMAAFVVTGAYGDDVIIQDVQNSYLEHIQNIRDQSLSNLGDKELTKEFSNLKTKMATLKQKIRDLLEIDQDEAAVNSDEYKDNNEFKNYIKRKEGVNEAIDNVIGAIGIIPDADNYRKILVNFKKQVQTARIEGNKLLEQKNSNNETLGKNKIQNKFKGDEKSLFNISNTYIEVRGYLYDCWNRIEKALTNKGIKTDEELAGEAAKKAAEEAAAKKAAEEAAAKKAAEEAAAKKAAEEKERLEKQRETSELAERLARRRRY